jgi:tRNA1Val (adenine37-N6)-methyltransferase
MSPEPNSASRDRLCGEWFIYQLRGGHRFSTDDMLTAWIGSREMPQARRLLDLGSGIGSVGLMALYRMSEAAELTMVEAQEISHQLAREAVQTNHLGHRVRVRLGDLRDPTLIPLGEQGSYDLVLGSPPYLPLGTGILSPHPQKAACRFELRGDVSDYCRAAALALAPDGVFALVHSAQDSRPEPAIHEALRSSSPVGVGRERVGSLSSFASRMGA